MDVMESDVARVTLIGEALAANYTSGGTNLKTIVWNSGGASWDIEAPWASVDENGNLVVTASGIYELEYADEASIDEEVAIQQLRDNYSIGFNVKAGNQSCNPKGVKDESQSLVWRYPPQPAIERMEGTDAAALIVAGSKVKGYFAPLSTFVGYGKSGRIVSSRTVTIRRIH